MKNLLIIFLSLALISSCGDRPKDMDAVEVVKAQNGDYDPEAKLKELGIELPTPSAPISREKLVPISPSKKVTLPPD